MEKTKATVRLAPFLSKLTMTLQIGDSAPDFTLPNQDGTSISLSSLKGQRVVIYFYPKDQTPGCIKEACNFRDRWDVFELNQIKVLGISKDGDDEAYYCN